MINKVNAEMYCAEPINLIENYDKAVSDTTQVWHCHHVWETMLGYSREELKEMDEYYGIPACNLIFLTNSEHAKIHQTGRKYSVESKIKMSEVHKGSFNNKCSKQILQFTLNGDFVKEWPSMSEVERQTGFSKSKICLCCSGKRKKAYNYIWKYKEN